VTSTDISPVAVEFQKEKHPKLNVFRADATSLPFEDGSFGRVIDKGTFDAVLTGGFKMARSMASEVRRVLQGDGVYVLISHSDERRVRHLETAFAKCEMTTIDRGWKMPRYRYICRGAARADL
jgi:SAM-dependent methyltransferase